MYNKCKLLIPLMLLSSVALKGAEHEMGSENSSMYAMVTTGNVAGVKRLLAHGADVNEPFEDGLTPVCSAAALGHVDMIRFLLGQGADLADIYGYCYPLKLAAHHGQVEVVKFLLEAGARAQTSNGREFKPLEMAIAAAQVLEFAGKNLKGAAHSCYTALHCTVQMGQLQDQAITVSRGRCRNA